MCIVLDKKGEKIMAFWERLGSYSRYKNVLNFGSVLYECFYLNATLTLMIKFYVKWKTSVLCMVTVNLDVVIYLSRSNY